MTEVTIEKKDLGRQMWDLLERKPEKYDVVFSVGVTKVRVQAVKFILEAASSVVEAEFEEKWDKAVIKDGEGIPLVDVDPVAFQLFVKLVTLDSWSVEVLKALDLSPKTLLALLSICRRFKITEAIKNLEEAAAHEFTRSFHHYKDTDEFLEMSQSNLATVVSFENLQLTEIDIFECVCRWGEFQCSQKGIEKTGENMRGILGAALFEIRFPTMSSKVFWQVHRRQKNLLTPVERLAIYDFIESNHQVKKRKYDENQLSFKTNARRQPPTEPKFDGSTLCLSKNRKLLDSSASDCNENENFFNFQITNGRIALHGIGFWGPINEDSYFDVSVKIEILCKNGWQDVCTKKEKRIFARKRETFHFMFDEPIVIEPISGASRWCNPGSYNIVVCLKGPSTMTMTVELSDEEEEEELEQSGVKFCFRSIPFEIEHVAEFLYKKL